MAESGAPLVSIGIPTFNRAARFERALASALRQTYANLEIVVSDNASSDATPDVCAIAGAADARVRIIRQRANIGAEANFRAVRDGAAGEYFMWLADDDWIEDNYLAECVGYLEQWRGYALVGGQATFYRADGTAAPGSATTIDHARPAERIFQYYSTVGDNAIFYGVMRRDLARSLVFENRIGQDWHMVAEVAFAGCLKTLNTTRIHRSAEGMSRSAASMVTYYKLKGRAARNVHAVITRDAFTSILWRTRAYREQDPAWLALTLRQRLALATRVYLAMFERWCMWDEKQPSIARRVELKLHRWALAWMRRPLSRWRKMSQEMRGEA